MCPHISAPHAPCPGLHRGNYEDVTPGDQCRELGARRQSQKCREQRNPSVQPAKSFRRIRRSAGEIVGGNTFDEGPELFEYLFVGMAIAVFIGGRIPGFAQHLLVNENRSPGADR